MSTNPCTLPDKGWLGQAPPSGIIEAAIPELILHSFTKSGVKQLRSCVAIPVKESITQIELKRLPKTAILLKVAILTAGAFAPTYAGALAYDLRGTCLSLGPVINGIATIIMTIFVDPKLSIMTDDVIEGKCPPQDFRNCVIGMVGSKTLGTFLAVFLLVPASYMIVLMARLL